MKAEKESLSLVISCEPQIQMQSILVYSDRKMVCSPRRKDIKMDARQKGFLGKSFTLTVGPDKTQLTVPYGFLERIPYFQAAIKGDFVENRTNEFVLEGLDPEAVADFIHFANNSQANIPFPEDDITTDAEAMRLIKHNLEKYRRRQIRSRGHSKQDHHRL